MGLSRRIAAWLSHLYPGRAAGQTQDCDCKPGQGESREVWETSRRGRIYIASRGCHLYLCLSA